MLNDRGVLRRLPDVHQWFVWTLHFLPPSEAYIRMNITYDTNVNASSIISDPDRTTVNLVGCMYLRRPRRLNEKVPGPTNRCGCCGNVEAKDNIWLCAWHYSEMSISNGPKLSFPVNFLSMPKRRLVSRSLERTLSFFRMPQLRMDFGWLLLPFFLLTKGGTTRE